MQFTWWTWLIKCSRITQGHYSNNKPKTRLCNNEARCLLHFMTRNSWAEYGSAIWRSVHVQRWTPTAPLELRWLEVEVAKQTSFTKPLGTLDTHEERQTRYWETSEQSTLIRPVLPLLRRVSRTESRSTLYRSYVCSTTHLHQSVIANLTTGRVVKPVQQSTQFACFYNNYAKPKHKRSYIELHTLTNTYILFF